MAFESSLIAPNLTWYLSPWQISGMFISMTMFGSAVLSMYLGS